MHAMRNDIPTHLPLRPATGADAAAIAALVNSAYRGDSSRAGWTTEADLLGGQRTDPEAVAAIVAAPDDVVLVHERDEGIAACVHLERTPAGCYLGMLTVRPTLQAGGVGRRLLASAEAWAAEHWGSARVYMTVIAQRPELIAWYERRGYTRTGERQPFPYGDARFGLPQRDDLVFEVLAKQLG
jgi:ribosomal protein S18 acetylase RimI-like enzyme